MLQKEVFDTNESFEVLHSLPQSVSITTRIKKDPLQLWLLVFARKSAGKNAKKNLSEHERSAARIFEQRETARSLGLANLYRTCHEKAALLAKRTVPNIVEKRSIEKIE